jgi:thiol:disulfide interchange protein
MDNSPKTICCVVAFLFIFIVLVAAITTTCYEQQNFNILTKSENFMNTYTLDTVKNRILQGKHYKALSPNDDLMFYLMNERKQPILVAVLADWCGFCKRLKKSGELTKVAKKMPVFVIDDQHPMHAKIMQAVKSPGFPTLAIFSKNKFHAYEGPQTADAILNVMNNVP